MGRLLAFVIAGALLAGCGGGAYWSDGAHRPHGGNGTAQYSTGPTADPDARASALPRAVVAMGREARGNPVPLGILTGLILLAAAVLGVYTVGAALRGHPPHRR